jgi:cytidylate kinase
LIERDHIDSTRKNSPLKKADDAITINNSNLTLEEQLTRALELVRSKTETE